MVAEKDTAVFIYALLLLLAFAGAGPTADEWIKLGRPAPDKTVYITEIDASSA